MVSLTELLKNHVYNMKSREVVLRLREKKLLNKTRILQDREQALREKEDALRERDAAIQTRELALRERDKAIIDRDKAIQDTFIDALTGCYNRNYFEKIMAENSNVDLNHNKVGFIFIDINNLKAVNDKQGHKAGDKLICCTANFLRENFRKNYDTVIRLGGDEFVVVCYNYREITIFEQALKEKMENCSANCPLDFAYGVAVFNKFTDDNFEDTKNRADKRMYDCKIASKAGR